MTILDRWLGLGSSAALAAEAALGRQRLSILIFHRILARPEPVYQDGLLAHWFDGLVARVAATFNVLTFGEALTFLAQDRLPPRALVFTFDDGYADNAELAVPILRRHGVAGTFFIASGFLDGGCMWNDQIIHCLRSSALDAVDLTSIGLSTMPLGSATERERAIQAALHRVKYMPLVDREQALDDVTRATGVRSLPTDLMMTTQQLQQMHACGMEIGGHTVRHPILTELDDATAASEIQQCRRRLQDLTGAPVDVFAYPNGKPGQDYVAAHVDMVRQAGYRGAVSTAQGTACPGSDLYQLPRFSPWDADPQRWVARLVARRYRRDRPVVATR